MKALKIPLLLIFFIFAITSCNELLNNKHIQLESVVAGGCNTDTPIIAEKSSDAEEKDTVYFTLTDESLNVFIGLNYICCAPFTADASIDEDTIYFNISDTCNFSEESCYCRCNCYYTWNFNFSEVTSNLYYYRVNLFDPRVGEAVLFKIGTLIIP